MSHWRPQRRAVQRACLANSRLGFWRIAGSWILSTSLTNEGLISMGYDDIAKRYEALHSSY